MNPPSMNPGVPATRGERRSARLEHCLRTSKPHPHPPSSVRAVGGHTGGRGQSRSPRHHGHGTYDPGSVGAPEVSDHGRDPFHPDRDRGVKVKRPTTTDQ